MKRKIRHAFPRRQHRLHAGLPNRARQDCEVQLKIRKKAQDVGRRRELGLPPWEKLPPEPTAAPSRQVTRRAQLLERKKILRQLAVMQHEEALDAHRRQSVLF